MPLAVLLCPGTNICGDFEPVAETIRDQPRDQEALFVRSPFGVEYWGCQGFLRISAARPVRADERSGILGTHLHHIVMPWLVCLALFALFALDIELEHAVGLTHVIRDSITQTRTD